MFNSINYPDSLTYRGLRYLANQIIVPLKNQDVEAKYRGISYKIKQQYTQKSQNIIILKYRGITYSKSNS